MPSSSRHSCKKRDRSSWKFDFIWPCLINKKKENIRVYICEQVGGLSKHKKKEKKNIKKIVNSRMCYEKGNEIEEGKRSYGSLNPRWMIVTKLFNWKRGWVRFIDAFLVDPVTRERAKENTFSRKHIGWLIKEKKNTSK